MAHIAVSRASQARLSSLLLARSALVLGPVLASMLAGCTAQAERPKVQLAAPDGAQEVFAPERPNVEPQPFGATIADDAGAKLEELATNVHAISVHVTPREVVWIDTGNAGNAGNAERPASIQSSLLPAGAATVRIAGIPGPQALAISESGTMFVALVGDARTPAGIYRVAGGELVAVSATEDDAQPGAMIVQGTDLYWLARGAGGTTLRRKPETGAALTIATQPVGDYSEASLVAAPPFVFAALNSGAGGVLVRARLDDRTAAGEAVANLPSGFLDMVAGPSGELFIGTTTGIARFEVATQALSVPFSGFGTAVALRRSGSALFFVSSASEELVRLPLNKAPARVLLESCRGARSLAVSGNTVYLARESSVVRVRL